MSEELMTLDEYQDFALRTWTRRAEEEANMGYLALGLCDEAGEVAKVVKRAFWHGKEIDREELKKELGDTLWYIAVFAHELGFTLEDVGAYNIVKLRNRYPAGFVQRWNNGR